MATGHVLARLDARSEGRNTGLESPANPQAGKSALRRRMPDASKFLSYSQLTLHDPIFSYGAYSIEAAKPSFLLFLLVHFFLYFHFCQVWRVMKKLLVFSVQTERLTHSQGR
jgi:hypothetical protein